MSLKSATLSEKKKISRCVLASLINRPHYEMTGTTSKGNKWAVNKEFNLPSSLGRSSSFPLLSPSPSALSTLIWNKKQQRRNDFVVQCYGKTVKGKPCAIRYFKTSCSLILHKLRSLHRATSPTDTRSLWTKRYIPMLGSKRS